MYARWAAAVPGPRHIDWGPRRRVRARRLPLFGHSLNVVGARLKTARGAPPTQRRHHSKPTTDRSADGADFPQWFPNRKRNAEPNATGRRRAPVVDRRSKGVRRTPVRRGECHRFPSKFPRALELNVVFEKRRRTLCNAIRVGTLLGDRFKTNAEFRNTFRALKAPATVRPYRTTGRVYRPPKTLLGRTTLVRQSTAFVDFRRNRIHAGKRPGCTRRMISRAQHSLVTQL